MNKLIAALIFIILFSINAYADQLPGYLKFGINASNFQSSTLQSNPDIYIVDLNFEYGAKFKYLSFNPYVFGANRTYSWNHGGNIRTDYEYSPFFGEYATGIGFRLFEILYVEFEHQCQHYISSLESDQVSYFRDYQIETYNKVTIGIEITVN